MTTTADTRLPAERAGDACVHAKPLRLLTSDGRLDPDSPLDLTVTPELCRGLYRDMVLARRLGKEAYNLQRQGELALWLSDRGQEGAQAGSARGVRGDDWIFPTYREHTVELIRGLEPGQILSQWRGSTHSGWDPAAYNVHVNTLVLGSQTLHATGYAMGIRMEGGSQVVMVYVGDGATSQGDVSEALNWACVMRAPIISLCQNNQWAISTSSRDQTAAPLHVRAAGFGLDSAYVDGNDALAVYAVTRAMAERVRAGGAPGFIEALTYRLDGHSTSDAPRRYRGAEDEDAWSLRDPVARLHALLDAEGWADAAWQRDLDAEADQLAADTRSACLALAEPRLEDTFAHTLVVESEQIRTERERYVAYRESFL